MEVGAVKQAFNNEIILLKKNLNQAKIHTIHKLTRKAKNLTEKKAPEHLKEKLKRKAESAVKEVLIIKKIKPRDIARFIVTHTGKLNDYLNKATVDNDKACARLLLHKGMQDKYKVIRGKFSNISIKDLFMSRQERLKLKKEAREKQKNKKKGKNSQTVNVEGEWDVEVSDTSKEDIKPDKNPTVGEIPSIDNDSGDDDMENGDPGEENEESDDESFVDSEIDDKSNDISPEKNKHDMSNEVDSDSEEIEKNNIVNKIKTKQSTKNNKVQKNKSDKINVLYDKVNDKPLKVVEKKHKDNKNKNLNEKIKNRKFNKQSNDISASATKVADPFFITSTGENYMSLVEPRQPDEVKEIHKQGNRKYRRAVMFGHEPKIKPKKQNFESYNEKKQEKFMNNKNKPSQNNFKKEINKEVPEKLHPSWEAKKKQSTIVPFKGKKTVFDES